MTEAISHRSMIDAGVNQIGRVSVPEVVGSDPRELQPLQPGIVVAIPDVVLVERLAAGPAKHQAVLSELRPSP